MKWVNIGEGWEVFMFYNYFLMMSSQEHVRIGRQIIYELYKTVVMLVHLRKKNSQVFSSQDSQTPAFKVSV